MKNIKTFENYNVIDIENSNPLKKYGEHFPINQLKVGDNITYIGSPYIVDMVDDYILILKSPRDGSSLRVNQNMFDQRGYIQNL